MKFADLLKRDGDTPAAIEAAIARAEQAAAQAVARMEELGKQRRATLVADEDKDLDRIERDLALATRDRDRAVEARLALGERLAEARKREHRAMVDGLHERAVKARDAAAEILRTKYAKVARAIVAAVEELQKLDAERETLNTRLRQAGDGRQVGSPDELTRPARGPVPLVSEPVYTRLAVPHPEDGARMLWPEGRDIFGGVALPERNAA